MFFGLFFGFFGFFLVLCASWVYLFLYFTPLCVQSLGIKDVPSTGHALWAEVGGGIIFVTPGKFAGKHKKQPVVKTVGFGIFCFLKLHMLALVGRPSLRSYDACAVYRVKRASRRNCRQTECETSFSPKNVFLISRNPLKRFWGLVFWYLWVGRARNPGPGSSHHLSVEVMNVGGWLTHCDLGLSVDVDFLAVTEHRLIPARVRSEWARLRAKGGLFYLVSCLSGFFSCWECWCWGY